MEALSALLLLALSLLCSPSFANQVGQTCIANRQCDPGLHCQTCAANAKFRSRCTRIRPINPFSKVKGLPFNRYSWLTTHNSFARVGVKSATGSVILAPTNQQDSVTEQLNNGVRGLMLDMYDFKNDVWLCHSFGGKCHDFTAFELLAGYSSGKLQYDKWFPMALLPLAYLDSVRLGLMGLFPINHKIIAQQPAINVLREIQTFLHSNPSEIITIFIEDHVQSPKGLTKVFDAAGLRKYWFPVSRMPKNGGDWPTVDDMIHHNQRLVVFTSEPSKEAAEGIANEWTYVVENQFGNGGLKPGSCPNRHESAAMNTRSRSLVLVNHFPTVANFVTACKHNSGPLMEALNACYGAAGKRWANFVAVDFYKRSNGGGAPEAVDMVNGHLICGCRNVLQCKGNMTYGACT